MVYDPPPDMNVRYHAEAFPPGTVLNSGQLTFNADDLAHALFVTGRAPGDRARYGVVSAYEWVHRTSLIPAYVRRTFRGARLTRSNLALELDRSEKTALSYALGQAMTAIFCEWELATAYLMHVDRYANHFGINFGATQQRSDLFGLAPSGWVVAEAKGRSSGVGSDLREKMVAQKRSVSDINGQRPWIALGCVAHFSPTTGYMQLSAFDPEEEDVETISLQISMDRLTLAYYLPFVRAIEIGDEEEHPSVDMASLGPLGLRVGLLAQLRLRVRSAELGELQGLHEDVTNILSEWSETSDQVRTDGTMVATSWTEAMSIDDWKTFLTSDYE
ncbi:hypothetical protein Lesp02_15780 [Lentzea sp. NBRC 105346]|nr:hypothetical protein Lesp02_15780 [Lentzea sp. NBRC 105346]